jgi:hypothetical protein
MPADASLLHPLTRAALESAAVDFEVMPCEPELADTAAFVAHYGVPADRSANGHQADGFGARGSECACLVLLSRGWRSMAFRPHRRNR